MQNQHPPIIQTQADDPGPERSVWGGRVLVAALISLFVLNLLWMVRNCEKVRPVRRDHGAPDFTVTRLDGKPFRLSEFRGRPVFIDFWATWCGPCKESLPILDQVYDRYKDRGLGAIAIETEGAEAPARAFVQMLGLKLPIGLGTPEVSEMYDVTTIPHLVLIDGEGKVRRVFHGVHSQLELSQAVEAAGLGAPAGR